MPTSLRAPGAEFAQQSMPLSAGRRWSISTRLKSSAANSFRASAPSDGKADLGGLAEQAVEQGAV
jgi:hypothetical protein